MRWFGYILCTAAICCGIFCGISLYQDMHAKSYINGELNIHNTFSQDSFNYSSSSVTFYATGEENQESIPWTFEKELLKVEGFDGERNKYKITLNDYILFADIEAGVISDKITIDFYDEHGELTHSADLNINITFYNNRTELKLETMGKTSADYLAQYFTNNGIRLQATQIL